jgi:hypothetical protein
MNQRANGKKAPNQKVIQCRMCYDYEHLDCLDQTPLNVHICKKCSPEEDQDRLVKRKSHACKIETRSQKRRRLEQPQPTKEEKFQRQLPQLQLQDKQMVGYMRDLTQLA